MRTRAQSDPQNVLTMTATIETDGRTFPSKKTAITLLTLHATVCVFWAILAGQPRDDWADLPFVTIMGINEYCINPIITIATAVAFALQTGTTRETQGPSALSRTTLLLQAVVFLVLAVSWPIRFKVPQNLWTQDDLQLLQVWYPLVGWTCINNAIIAIGYSIVQYAASSRVNSSAGQDREREALLST